MIDIQHLTYAYTDGASAVNDVSVRIAPQDTVGVVGSNGAGKSTLLKMLCGVLQPASGEIMVDGMRVNKSNLAELRRKVGFVFQNPDDQLFMSSVFEDIAFGLRNYGDSDEQVEEKVCNVLNRFEIAHLAKRAPFTLSGGEKRTAAMACVLAMGPSVVVFGGPTAFLDLKARRTFINMARELTTTNVIVSHDFELIFELCNRVIIMREGKIVGDGEPKTLLFNSEVMEAAGLETPYVTYVCEQCGKLTTSAP